MGIKDNAVSLLTEFYNTLEPSVDLVDLDKKTWRRVYIGNGNFISAYYDKATLNAVVQYFFKNNRIADNYTLGALESLIAERLITVFVEEPDKVRERVNDLLSELNNPMPVVMNVYMSIHGTSVSKRERIGEFEFIPAGDYDGLGIRCYDQQTESYVKDQIWQNHDHVMVSVSACDTAKAREKAYSKFQWLENAARLFVDSDFYDIGITSFNFSHVENSLITDLKGKYKGSSSGIKGSPYPLPFEKTFKTGNHLCRVVNTLGRGIDELTELQQRVHHAVYLGGLSVRETVPEVSYFLAVSAMEALFQKETDKYVNPSIAQQIIEAFCYLVADDANRRNVFESMRPFYGKRSAFAHGGKKSVSNEEAQMVRGYLRIAILKFIDDPVLSSLKSIDEVIALICDKKFGVKGS